MNLQTGVRGGGGIFEMMLTLVMSDGLIDRGLYSGRGL